MSLGILNPTVLNGSVKGLMSNTKIARYNCMIQSAEEGWELTFARLSHMMCVESRRMFLEVLHKLSYISSTHNLTLCCASVA
jgi:hypothetical protein